jgi:ABC-type branched-subunit amino acid transport system permease subunit
MFSPQNVLDWLQLAALTLAQGFLLHEVGLASLGLGGVLLLGAYAFGFSLLGGSTVAVIASATLIAVVMAMTVLRVQGDVFAVVTLAFATILHRTAVGATRITGGALGLGPLERPAWMATDRGAILMCAALLAIAAIAYAGTVRSRAGVVLGGTRDNDLATRSSGHATPLVRLGAVIGATAAVGLVGATAAGYYGLVTPQMGVLDVTLRALAAAMLARPLWRQGRPGKTIAGYVLTSGVLVFAPPLLRSALPGVEEAVFRQVLFGVVLYALVQPAVLRRLGARVA